MTNHHADRRYSVRLQTRTVPGMTTARPRACSELYRPGRTPHLVPVRSQPHAESGINPRCVDKARRRHAVRFPVPILIGSAAAGPCQDFLHGDVYSFARHCAACSRSWRRCARPAPAARGIWRRISRPSRPIRSRKPTRSPTPSRAATSPTSRRNSATSCSRSCFTPAWREEARRLRFRRRRAGDHRKAHPPPSACLRR